jgi:tetratricopeptide (TPR) repeat protein
LKRYTPKAVTCSARRRLTFRGFAHRASRSTRMEFKEAEERFYELKRRLDAGVISQEEFKAQVERLKVQDSQGRYWMIGVQSGKWYFYDGTRWVRAEPPEEGPPSEERPRGPVAPTPEQPPRPPTSPEPRPRRRGIPGALLALIPLGLILACCLSVVAVGAADYLISSHPISSALSDLLGRPIGFEATPTPTPHLEESPTPTMTATPSAEELIALGDQLVFQGQLEEAIAHYQMATAVDPQNALAHLKLGETYLALGRCEEAIPEFQQALVIDPHLAEAQEGLRECAGPPPPMVTFASYVRADLGLSILYPDTWILSEQENQTIFAESEEALEHLAGSVFIFASLPLETQMSNTQALEERIATLPPGTQVGEMEPAYISGQEWASVHGEMSGEAVPSPSRVYMAATVWHSRLYALWALAPTDTWKDVAWPIFQAMLRTIKIQEVVAEAPTATPTPPLTPTATPTPTSTPMATPTPAPSPTPEATPAPPALSGRIAFTVYEGGKYETYVANIDGSERQRILNGMRQPDFNPQGNILAANGEYPDQHDLQHIIINRDNTAGQRRAISEHPEDSWPSWSPDGSHIVFVFNIGKRRVKILSDVTEATEGDPIDGPGGMKVRGKYTVWAGDRIAFTTCDYWGTGSNCGIYTIGEGGGAAVQISDDSQDRATDALGNQILYMSPTDGDWEIWKVSSTGGGRQRLTNNSAQDGLATWSPDGQHIAFLTNRTGSWEIWVMNADGTGQRRLFSIPGDVGEWTEERISWGTK